MCPKSNLIYIYISFIVFFLIAFSASESISFQNKVQPSSEKELRTQIQDLAYESGRSSARLQKALNNVDEIANLDSISQIVMAINAIDTAEQLYFKANQDSDLLSEFILKNKTRLKKNNMSAFIDMEGLINEMYYTHRKALGNFLKAYKTMLEYFKDNLDDIAQGQKPQRDIYEELFYKYRTALDANNEAYIMYIKFVDQYISKRPVLAEMMSKARRDLGE